MADARELEDDADRTPEADLPAANTALCLARQHPEHRHQHLREFERLVDNAARRERAKRATPGRAKRRKHGTPDDDGSGYLSQPLVFSEGRLVDAEGGAVMMGWEDGLMRHHAAALRQRLDDGPASVLNVGFGLGLIDEALQREWHGVRGFTHTIIEAHPDVLRHARRLGWHERPGVTLLAGRWQQAVPAPDPNPDPAPNPNPNSNPDPDPNPNPSPNPDPHPDPDPNPNPITLTLTLTLTLILTLNPKP